MTDPDTSPTTPDPAQLPGPVPGSVPGAFPVGAQGMEVPASTGYEQPEYETRKAKSKGRRSLTVVGAVAIPLAAVAALAGMFLMSRSAAATAAQESATSAVNAVISSAIAGTSSQGMDDMCPPQPDWAWALYQETSKDSVTDPSQVFTQESFTYTAADSLPGVGLGARPVVTVFDQIVPPAYTQWAILYGQMEYTPTGVPSPVSFHVAIDASGKGCVAAVRMGVDDVSAMIDAGSTKEFRARNQIDKPSGDSGN